MADGWNKLTQALLGTSPQPDVKTRLETINEKVKRKETLAPEDIKFLQTQGGLNVTPQEKVAVGDSSYTKYNVSPLYVQKDGADYRDARGKRTLNPIYDTSPLADVGAGVALAGQAAQKESNPYTKLGMLIGGAVGGLINPNLAGKQKYLRDKAEAEKKTLQSMTLTEAELKLQAANASINKTKAYIDRTNIVTAARGQELKDKMDDDAYDTIARVADAFDYFNANSDTAMRESAGNELRRRLSPILTSEIGLSAEAVSTLSQTQLRNLSSIYAYEKGAARTAFKDGSYIIQNRAGNFNYMTRDGKLIVDPQVVRDNLNKDLAADIKATEMTPEELDAVSKSAIQSVLQTFRFDLTSDASIESGKKNGSLAVAVQGYRSFYEAHLKSAIIKKAKEKNVKVEVDGTGSVKLGGIDMSIDDAVTIGTKKAKEEGDSRQQQSNTYITPGNPLKNLQGLAAYVGSSFKDPGTAWNKAGGANYEDVLTNINDSHFRNVAWNNPDKVERDLKSGLDGLDAEIKTLSNQPSTPVVQNRLLALRDARRNVGEIYDVLVKTVDNGILNETNPDNEKLVKLYETAEMRNSIRGNSADKTLLDSVVKKINGIMPEPKTFNVQTTTGVINNLGTYGLDFSPVPVFVYDKSGNKIDGIAWQSRINESNSTKTFLEKVLNDKTNPSSGINAWNNSDPKTRGYEGVQINVVPNARFFLYGNTWVVRYANIYN